MNCSCGGSTTVRETRPSGTSTRRRRECLSCGNKFTTYEAAEWDVEALLESQQLLVGIECLAPEAREALQNLVDMMPKDPDKLGYWVRKRRESKGLSQADLAVLVGVDQNTICNLEIGRNNTSHKTVAGAILALTRDD